MKTKITVLNKERNVYLKEYVLRCGEMFPFHLKRPAVIVLPGGGYNHCSERESTPVAMAYASRGYHAFVLHYSVAENFKWPRPLEDYEQAYEYIKQNADEWCVDMDKIAVLGFSAGGHLCASVSTLSKYRPAAAILGYPVTRELKIINMLVPDMAKNVSEKTPPTFLFSARDDGLVPISHSLDYINALDKHGVDFEVHIYSRGGHGFSMGTDEMIGPNSKEHTPRIKDWVQDSFDWLDELFFPKE